MDRSKEAVAQRLAEAHYRVEPGIVTITRLLGSDADEADPTAPIKLLEVNANTTAVGLRPVYFGSDPVGGIFYPSAIIEVTPEEFEDILREPERLPNGWKLGPEIRPPVSAARQ
ncbi:MAG: hypothetical protein ABIP55_02040 [Tepidisphaeraceae bacterium]